MKTFNFSDYVGTALENLKPLNTLICKPKILHSPDPNVEIRAMQDKQYKAEFQAEYDGYMKWK
jgi:hypothetical protein